jgi:hypothetical protein
VLWLHVYGYKSDRYHHYNGFIHVSWTDIHCKYHIYGLQFFYAAILRILKQSVAIAITLLLFRAHSQTYYGGKVGLP